LAGLAGGGALAQFPEFYQQYLQRLAGRMDEVRQRADEIARDAVASGLDVQAYIARFLDSPAHAMEGERMAEALEWPRRWKAQYAWTPHMGRLLMLAHGSAFRSLCGTSTRHWRAIREACSSPPCP
jgi:hypothetical protein